LVLKWKILKITTFILHNIVPSTKHITRILLGIYFLGKSSIKKKIMVDLRSAYTNTQK